MPNTEKAAELWRSRRLRRWAVGLAIAYVVYALGLGVIAPRAAREPIEESVGELLGVRVGIERISVNPFTLRFELAGIEARDASGGLLLSADALVANLELLKSVVGVLRVSEIRLEALAVRADLSETGELNLLALMPEEDDDPEEPETEEDDDGGLFPVRVDEIHLVNGSIRAFDRSQEHLFVANIEPIDLVIHHISTVPDEEGRVRLEATGSRGVHLVTELEASVDPISARGELVLEGLRHNMIGDYLGPRFVMRPTAGQIDIRTDFAIEMDDASGLVVRIEKGGIEARGWHVESDLAEVSSVALDRFAIEGFRLALAEREVGIAQIVLEGPRIEAVLPGPDTGEQPEPVAAEPAEAEPGAEVASTPDQQLAGDAEPTTEAGEEWHLEVDRFAIAGGRLSLASADARDEALVAIGPIDFEALGISSTPDEDIEVSVRIALPDDAPTAEGTERTSGEGPRLALDGRVVPRPFSAELELTAIEVALAPWSPIVGFAPGTRISKGRLDVSSTVQAKLAEDSESPQVSASANATLRGLLLEQPRGPRGEPAPVIRVGRLVIDRLRVQDTGSRIDMGTIRVDSPAIRLERDARGELNLAQLMAAAPQAEREQNEEPGPSLTLEVRRVELADGRLDYRDRTTKRVFELEISDVAGSFERKKAADGTPEGLIDFDGRVDGAAPLAIDGRFLSPGQLDVELSLAGLSVTKLAPYFEQYIGSEVEQGKLYLDLDYTLAGRKIAGQNKLRFDRLVFGKRTGSEDALKLPVPLAFKLLTDTQGQTKLDLPPIKGDLDDPNFSLRALIATAFVKVVQQALSSPLAVLQTAMPDLTADKQTHVSFAVGSATLDEAQREKLMNVATIVASEPKHRVAIKGRVDTRRDGRALKNAGEEVDDERLRALGDARARAVLAELVDRLGLEADRIFVRSVDLEGEAEDDLVPVDVVLTDD